jgi:hypothetical protein
MSQKLIKKLGKELLEYTREGAGKDFRNDAKHEAHTFLVSHRKIKGTIKKAINAALNDKAALASGNLENKIKTFPQKIQKKLNEIIDNAVEETINNIKSFFNINNNNPDFKIQITRVIGIESITQGGINEDRSSFYRQTIFDNIKKSFDYLKRPEGLPLAINSLLSDNGIEEKITELNFVLGHVTSITERRTSLSAGRIKKYFTGETLGITWKDFIDLFSKEDQIVLRKLAKKGTMRFRWIVEIEDGLSNNPKKKLIKSIGIQESRLYSAYTRILKEAQKKVQDRWPNEGGSDNPKTAIRKSITKKVKTGLKKDKRIKVKIKDDSEIEYPSGQPVRVKTKKYSAKKAANKSTEINGPEFRISIQPDDSAINLNALKAQINAKLTMTVIKNMGTPALENRTGRFARSVEVTDVIQTPKGFPSIGYTYQKGPYQTFEPGFAQGSTQRDPRVVISKSIREIAKELIVGRFYTRRV